MVGSLRLYKFFFIFLLFILASCAKEVKTNQEVYSNTFESNDLTGIESGTIESFNGTKVLGRYNNGGFKLTVDNLPKHDLIEISFNLYLHDSWDGNKAGDSGRNGPDIWSMLLQGNTYINTTFSNSDCGTDFLCNPQSYPSDYINSTNKPKTGAFRVDLPGACQNASLIGGTSLYRIIKQIRHDERFLILECLDKLIQTNTADPKCDESWSVDNIKINAIRL